VGGVFLFLYAPDSIWRGTIDMSRQVRDSIATQVRPYLQFLDPKHFGNLAIALTFIFYVCDPIHLLFLSS
jgi:hypothetical protein